MARSNDELADDYGKGYVTSVEDATKEVAWHMKNYLSVAANAGSPEAYAELMKHIAGALRTAKVPKQSDPLESLSPDMREMLEMMEGQPDEMWALIGTILRVNPDRSIVEQIYGALRGEVTVTKTDNLVATTDAVAELAKRVSDAANKISAATEAAATNASTVKSSIDSGRRPDKPVKEAAAKLETATGQLNTDTSGHDTVTSDLLRQINDLKQQIDALQATPPARPTRALGS